MRLQLPKTRTHVTQERVKQEQTLVYKTASRKGGEKKRNTRQNTLHKELEKQTRVYQTASSAHSRKHFSSSKQ